MTLSAPEAIALEIPAADGYCLRGLGWFAPRQPGQPVTVINAATSVQCRYYARFAAWLHSRGHDVIVYDYRGIGLSRPARLRGFRANWADWGALDCEAVLRYALSRFPDRPVDAALAACALAGCICVRHSSAAISGNMTSRPSAPCQPT